MSAHQTIVRDLQAEADEDYVGVWQVFRLLRERCTGIDVRFEDVLRVVQALLDVPGMEIGQFSGEVFVPWPGDANGRLHRLSSELQALGRVPDIGDVAWLVRR